ncbi:MAG: OmpW family outer membrane protein [Gemmatimonadota bacterium]|nr:OmpW family outer membrane protein [Gemmatimonadota bacterium]
MRRFSVGFTVAALSLVLPAAARAQEEHPWMVRARGIVVAPNASSKPSGLDVQADATAEIDISRRLAPFLSVELVLATASQEVKSGSTSLGTVQHLPPTLVLQFHPIARGGFDPYVGAGGNLTIFYGKSGGLEALDLTTSVGYALNAGFDIPLGTRGVFNVDGKYVNIKTDVKSGGTKVYALKINPFVIGAGFGYRF